MPREKDFKKTLCADIDGLSLHAAVRCGADDRQALEQLCRYITRPALANERVQTNASGQVVLKLKTAWLDGTTHLVMSPLEFMQPSIERSVCGGQIRWFYVCRGSIAGLHERRLAGSTIHEIGLPESGSSPPAPYAAQPPLPVRASPLAAVRERRFRLAPDARCPFSLARSRLTADLTATRHSVECRREQRRSP